jgi:hypothetical protein
MMTNKTHQVADFDSIVEDETSRQILASVNLLPSGWGLKDGEEKRILIVGVKINVVPKVRGAWPACYVGADNEIDVADDFLKLDTMPKDAKIATILHEVGHAVDAIQSKLVEKRDVNMETNPYLKAMDRRYGNDRKAIALEEEFFADDYARHCGFEEALRSVLLTLENIDPQRIKRIESDEPILRSFELNPRDHIDYPD